MAKYVPDPVPRGDDVDILQRYIEQELNKISSSFATGEFLTIRLDALGDTAMLPRPQDGDIAFFADTANTPAQAPGLFEFRNGGWFKL